MTASTPERVLSIVVCGAGPAVEIATFVKLAIVRGWTVQVIATPPALEFFDQAAVEALTGSPVRSKYSAPGSPRSRIPDAIAVAPATYNTINKWAQGISDTYALGILAEQTGRGLPIVVLPFLNTALASRAPFKQSVKSLRGEGVSILLGPGAIEPHEPHTGGSLIDSHPWHLALDEVGGMVGTIDDEEDDADA
jgi:phosphopantothenoylcysteine synthetase/decarboxylase